jgi:hypothetical protein
MSNLQKWIDALRSGDYEQGTEHLLNNWSTDEEGELVEKDTYCCLGVACALFDPEWLMDRLAEDNTATTDVSVEVAMKLAEEGVNLESEFGEFDDENISFLLGTKNDHGYTFAQIADALENDPSLYGLTNWFDNHPPEREN